MIGNLLARLLLRCCSLRERRLLLWPRRRRRDRLWLFAIITSKIPIPTRAFDGVTTSKLIEQMSWLQHEGYTAISVNDLLAARAGKKPLPAKAVLLTFDDGYECFYTRVYPVLKAFHYPAVIGDRRSMDEGQMSIAETHPGDRVAYGESTMPRSAFLTWPQLREMKSRA